MSSKRVFSFMLAAAMVATFCNESFAQRGSHGPIRRAGRFLGIGWGDGYHKKNPLIDPSYYNPYTAHNSNLHTRESLGGYGYMGGMSQQTHYAPGFGYPTQLQGQSVGTSVGQPQGQGRYYMPGQYQNPNGQAQPNIYQPTPRKDAKGYNDIPREPTRGQIEADGSQPAGAKPGEEPADGEQSVTTAENALSGSYTDGELFDQPVIGARDFELRADTTQGEASQIDPETFWTDDN